MVFSSLEFLFCFFAATMLIYYLTPVRWRNIILLITSLAFYGWGEPVYVFIMLFSITVDYICGWGAGTFRESSPKKAKRFMLASIIINLSVLGFFKYYDFLADMLRHIPFMGWLPRLGIPLPIGISFYTFQTMSYTIDVYRADAKIQRNIASFGAYVTLFPQLIAGPIVRYQDVDDQLRHREHTVTMIASGLRTFVCGMAKKILLANAAGALWDSFRNSMSAEANALGAWAGIIFYAFQIYFDFSGYSDMAIGLGKMMGFRFKENFFYPYMSESITEFWRRWHISLGTWFREYVYIPLGGNRAGKWKTYRNIFAVWFLTGLWHGASWNYIIWGLYYCALLVIEKTFLLRLTEKIPSALRRAGTLFFVLIGWLIFVFEDMGAGVQYLTYMFGGAPALAGAALYDVVRTLPFLAVLIIASTPLPKKVFWKLWQKGEAVRCALSVGTAATMTLCVAYLVDSSYNPFLYFRF